MVASAFGLQPPCRTEQALVRGESVGLCAVAWIPSPRTFRSSCITRPVDERSMEQTKKVARRDATTYRSAVENVLSPSEGTHGSQHATR
jgi:hypothetical protein